MGRFKMNNVKKDLSSEELLNALKWRYAVKLFDANRKISAELWSTLEEALILTPSSYGLQPWKMMVICDESLKAKLKPLSWNQRQVTDCSHYIVFAAKMDVTVEDIQAWVKCLAAGRGVAESTLDVYRDWMIKDLIQGPRHAVIHEWASRQCYIALGNLMTAAALLGVDTCPMEGIEPPAYDQLLDLPRLGYKTVVACAVGYRDDGDKYAAAAKVRFKSSDILIYR